MLLRKNDVIVFQGDSVTDAGRMRDEAGLGSGYPAMVAGALKSLYADYDLTMYNRGIGGNRVEHLVERWKTDTLDLNPTIVTLLIGVNNVWHSYVVEGVEYDIHRFEQDLVSVVEQTIQTGARLVVLEPFAFHHDVFPTAWRERLYEIQQVIRNVALRSADAFIPLDGIFYQEALKRGINMETNGAVQLSADGVHPTAEGHRLIAREILKVLTE